MCFAIYKDTSAYLLAPAGLETLDMSMAFLVLEQSICYPLTLQTFQCATLWFSFSSAPPPLLHMHSYKYQVWPCLLKQMHCRTLSISIRWVTESNIFNMRGAVTQLPGWQHQWHSHRGLMGFPDLQTQAANAFLQSSYS